MITWFIYLGRTINRAELYVIAQIIIAYENTNMGVK